MILRIFSIHQLWILHENYSKLFNGTRTPASLALLWNPKEHYALNFEKDEDYTGFPERKCKRESTRSILEMVPCRGKSRQELQPASSGN